MIMTAPTFNWSIQQLERYSNGGVVYVAYWQLSATDETGSASATGSIGFTEPTQKDFIPFEDLTEEIVVSWVKDRLGQDQITALENGLVVAIAEKANPPLALGLPWASQPEATNEEPA